ncbi:MAG: PAS domain S-box protein [Alphaproteobacteria bacterium]
MQEALSASETRYRALFDDAPIGILVSEGDLVDEANAVAAQMLGERDPATIIGRPHLDFIDPAHRDEAREQLAALAPGETIDPFEATLVRSDGSSFRALVAITSITVDNRSIVLRTFRDISAEFAARDALRESEEKYRSLIDLFPDSVILTSRSIITQVNAAGVRMHAAEDENELIGRDWIELVDDSFHDKVFERRASMARGELADATDFLMKRVDGSTFWAEGRAIQVTVGGEKMFMTVSRDVTREREASQALMTSEENYRQLTELSPEAITVQGMDTVLLGNEAAAVLYGFPSAEELAGQDLLGLFSDEQQQRFRITRERILTGAPPFRGDTETFTNARNEEKSVVTSVASIEWNGEPACLVVNQDVTSVRRAQKALEAANAELARSNEDLAQFAYVASHDLKEPLRMVSSYCQLISDRYSEKLDDRGKEFVHYAVDGAVRMRTLIDDLLVYSRIGREGLEQSDIDLNAVVQGVLETLAPAVKEAGANITVSDLPTVNGHRSEMDRLFQNLIGNAIKFRSGQPLRVDISAITRNGKAAIRVADNGIGIPDRYLEQVFGVFKRLHNRTQYEGTGIGLAICEKIVQQMGGEIRAEPGEEGGTTFIVTLPVGGKPR